MGIKVNFDSLQAGVRQACRGENPKGVFPRRAMRTFTSEWKCFTWDHSANIRFPRRNVCVSAAMLRPLAVLAFSHGQALLLDKAVLTNCDGCCVRPAMHKMCLQTAQTAPKMDGLCCPRAPATVMRVAETVHYAEWNQINE